MPSPWLRLRFDVLRDAEEYPLKENRTLPDLLTIPPEIHVRSELRPGDVGAVIRLHGILYGAEYQFDYTFEGYVAEGLVQFLATYDPARDRIWLAEEADRLMGCIAIVHRSDTEAQLRWFLLHPECRGRGLGRSLLSQALAFCRTAGYRSVLLWTLRGLHAATHLYQSVGFRLTETHSALLWGKTLTEERYDLNLDTPQP